MTELLKVNKETFSKEYLANNKFLDVKVWKSIIYTSILLKKEGFACKVCNNEIIWALGSAILTAEHYKKDPKAVKPRKLVIVDNVCASCVVNGKVPECSEDLYSTLAVNEFEEVAHITDFEREEACV